LLLGSSLLEEESNAVRLAMAGAMSCTHRPEAQQQMEQEAPTTSWGSRTTTVHQAEWMLAEVSVDLLCQQIRGSSTAARYRACLPRVPRFLCTGHRKRPHLYSQVCRARG
jgi:hypothetical protein